MVAADSVKVPQKGTNSLLDYIKVVPPKQNHKGPFLEYYLEVFRASVAYLESALLPCQLSQEMRTS